MADAPEGAAATDPQGVVFNIDKIYVKDMSIEIPHAPLIFLETEPPALETQINVDASAVADGQFEVVVTATVTTRVKDKVAFLVEVKQAGLFEARNFPPEQLDPLLGIHCTTLLFPYLRANVADLITRAGFPALHLPTVNFEAFYAQRVQQLQAVQAAQANSGTPVQ